MISNEEIIEKWRSPLYKGKGYVLWGSNSDGMRNSLNNAVIDRILIKQPNLKVLYISRTHNLKLEKSNNIQTIQINNDETKLLMKISCGLLIIDTYDLTRGKLEAIVRQIKFKYVLIHAYSNESIRYTTRVPLINIESYKLVNSTRAVELTGIDKMQYDKYTNYISEKMALFNVPEEELMSLDGITNTFELIQACAVGRDGQIANYYRRYLAELLGWSSDMDTSIDYMREIDENFNPHVIGETSNIIMGSVRGRGDILKNSADKRKLLLNTIRQHDGKSIVVIAPSAQMAEDIQYKLNSEHIKSGIYHNYIKSRTIVDELTGVVFTYKGGKNAGKPKLFGTTSIKKNTISSYNSFKHNVLVTFGKLDANFKPNRVDVIIIANLNIDYDNVFYNANFIFPTNKTIEIIYIYTDEKKEVHKLKNFMYNNGIKQSKKRGIHRNM